MVSLHFSALVLCIAPGLCITLSAPLTAIVDQAVNVTWTKDSPQDPSDLTICWSPASTSRSVEGCDLVQATTPSGSINVAFLHTGQYSIAAWENNGSGGGGGNMEANSSSPQLLTYIAINVESPSSVSTVGATTTSASSSVLSTHVPISTTTTSASSSVLSTHIPTGTTTTSASSSVSSTYVPISATTTSASSSVLSTSATASSTSETSSQLAKAPLIIGIVLGATVIMGLLLTVCILRLRRKRRLPRSSLTLTETSTIEPFSMQRLDMKDEQHLVSFYTKGRGPTWADHTSPVENENALGSPDITQLHNELDDLRREVDDLRLRAEPSPPDYSSQ